MSFWKRPIMIVTLLCMTLTLQAQPTQFTFSLGKNYPGGNSILKSANLLGIRVTHYLSERYALRAAFEHMCSAKFRYIPEDNTPPPPGYIKNPAYKAPDETNSDRYFLNIRHDFHIPLTLLWGYVFGGVGYERYYHEAGNVDSKPFANLGTGFQIPIQDHFIFNSEINFIQKFDCNQHDVTFNLGVGYRFDPQQNSTTLQTLKLHPLKPLPEPKEPKTATPGITKSAAADIIRLQPLHTAETIDRVRYTPKPVHATSRKFYVQLAAAHKINPAYLRKLRALEEPYTIRKKSGLKLLLAGPYKNRRIAEVKKYKLKSIDEGAFVKKLP